jgi:hypothetical protein
MTLIPDFYVTSQKDMANVTYQLATIFLTINLKHIGQNIRNRFLVRNRGDIIRWDSLVGGGPLQ